MGSLLNKHFSSNSQSSDKGDSCLTLTEDAQSEQVSQSIWYEYSSKNDSFYHDNELAFFSSTIISMKDRFFSFMYWPTLVLLASIQDEINSSGAQNTAPYSLGP